MTERKPLGMPYETWIDKQIREAEERGTFKDLPGAGKPIADLDRPHDELWWVKQMMRREGVSVVPPTLALRKEAEDIGSRVAKERNEADVRRVVAELNTKIIEATRKPLAGPPLNLMPLDVERVVGEWRGDR
jgi:hypothetical protein